jgi:hypothetical protein
MSADPFATRGGLNRHLAEMPAGARHRDLTERLCARAAAFLGRA